MQIDNGIDHHFIGHGTLVILWNSSIAHCLVLVEKAGRAKRSST